MDITRGQIMVLGKLLSGGLVDSVGKIVDDLHVSE